MHIVFYDLDIVGLSWHRVTISLSGAATAFVSIGTLVGRTSRSFLHY